MKNRRGYNHNDPSPLWLSGITIGHKDPGGHSRNGTGDGDLIAGPTEFG
jgi:hypothetical protein